MKGKLYNLLFVKQTRIHFMIYSLILISFQQSFILPFFFSLTTSNDLFMVGYTFSYKYSKCLKLFRSKSIKLLKSSPIFVSVQFYLFQNSCKEKFQLLFLLKAFHCVFFYINLTVQIFRGCQDRYYFFVLSEKKKIVFDCTK